MRVLLFVVLVAVCWARKYNDGQEKLRLAVYFESKCPDSVKFITRQLVPTMRELRDYVDLTFVPFGKAHSISKTRKQIEFTCQHGPSECLGNRMQSCALHYMQMKGQSDREMLDYVACEMSRFEGVKGRSGCVEAADLSVYDVNNCVISDQGTALQLQAEQATRRVEPQFIPAITINGVFDQQKQDSAQYDLVGTLCSMLPYAPPCSAQHNNKALVYLLRYRDY